MGDKETLWFCRFRLGDTQIDELDLMLTNLQGLTTQTCFEGAYLFFFFFFEGDGDKRPSTMPPVQGWSAIVRMFMHKFACTKRSYVQVCIILTLVFTVAFWRALGPQQNDGHQECHQELQSDEAGTDSCFQERVTHWHRFRLFADLVGGGLTLFPARLREPAYVIRSEGKTHLG